MSDVRFENQGEEYGAPAQRTGGFDLSGNLVKWGVVSSRAQAQYVLVIIAILACATAIFVFYNSSKAPEVPSEPVYSGTV